MQQVAACRDAGLAMLERLRTEEEAALAPAVPPSRPSTVKQSVPLPALPEAVQDPLSTLLPALAAVARLGEELGEHQKAPHALEGLNLVDAQLFHTMLRRTPTAVAGCFEKKRRPYPWRAT